VTLAIDAVGLAKDYPTHLGLRRTRVLDQLELRVEAGGVLGLVGPNGSGKSTLLRMLAGIDFPSAGRLGVLGGSPADAQVRARVGYLPEGSPYPLELSPACRARHPALALTSCSTRSASPTRHRVPCAVTRAACCAASDSHKRGCIVLS